MANAKEGSVKVGKLEKRADQMQLMRKLFVGREVELLDDGQVEMVGICTEVRPSRGSKKEVLVVFRDETNAGIIPGCFEDEAVEGLEYRGSSFRRRVRISQRSIFVTTKREWEIYGLGEEGRPKISILLAGRHELERIANPFGHDAPWLVLKGTKRGMAEGSWKQWQNGVYPEGHAQAGEPLDWGEFECVFEEDTSIIPM